MIPKRTQQKSRRKFSRLNRRLTCGKRGHFQ